MRWKDEPWIVADVETTGLDAAADRVIEVGFCRVEGRRVAERASWLVDPGLSSLHPRITEITGLRIEDLRGQPSFREIAGMVDERFASVAVIAAYNAPFDYGFFAAELGRAGRALDPSRRPWLDPYVYVKEFDKYERGKKLTEAAARRGITVDGAHRAAADAEMAARLLLALLDSLPDDLQELIESQDKWRRAQDADFASWKKRNPKPPATGEPAPPKIAAALPVPSLPAVPELPALPPSAGLKIETSKRAGGDPDALDVSRVTGGPGDPFAPSDVLRARRRLDLAGFEEAYVAEMRLSYRAHRPAWDALSQKSRVLLVCDCDESICHARVLGERILPKVAAAHANPR